MIQNCLNRNGSSRSTIQYLESTSKRRTSQPTHSTHTWDERRRASQSIHTWDDAKRSWRRASVFELPTRIPFANSGQGRLPKHEESDVDMQVASPAADSYGFPKFDCQFVGCLSHRLRTACVAKQAEWQCLGIVHHVIM